MGPDGGGGLELPAVAVVVGDAYGGGGDAQVRRGWVDVFGDDGRTGEMMRPLFEWSMY